MSASTLDSSPYHHLGFDDVRLWLAEEAAGDPVRHQFSKLTLGTSPGEISEQFSKINEFMVLIEQSSTFHVRAYDDLHETLRLLALDGSTLSVSNLLAINNILEQCRVLQKSYKNSQPLPESLWKLDFEKISPLPKLEQDLAQIIGPDGEVQDHASSTLAALRRKLRKSGGAVRTRMNELVKKYAGSGYLNEAQAGIKGGRLVLPVVSSYKHQVKGVIQDMSNTGTTTFIEPFEIIELNNQIKTMEIEEQQEVQRILRDLTALFHAHHTEIETNYSLLQTIDFHMALAKFAKTFACSIPVLTESRQFRLKEARNPRLALQREVVPLNLHMDENTTTLIITGPNAGGKTVALKTIGLLAIMANAGVPIPAKEGSIVPSFDRIFADIGDQQSLVDDLSTFSAHIGTIINILEESSSQSLVLLDELGTGTDPAEGGALARSILESLSAGGVKTVATTHLGDLKVFAHETDHILNGAMEFDQEELKPTYKFQAGVPGSSYGFEIAKRVGLAETILNAARRYIGWARDSMEQLLRSLESERVALATLKSDNSQLQRDLNQKQKRIDSALKALTKAERKADRDAALKAGKIISDARQTVEKLIRQIKESQAGKESIRDVHAALDGVEARLDKVLDATETPLKLDKIGPEELVKGASVTVLSMDQVGTVLKGPSKGKVLVEVDGKRMQIPVDWLGRAPAKKKKQPGSSPVVRVARQSSGSSYSLDLRGYRAEAAIEELNRFIDQAVLRNLAVFQIIHGKGTGVIKQLVHEILDQHPNIGKKRLGGQDEGGAGITFVELK